MDRMMDQFRVYTRNGIRSLWEVYPAAPDGMRYVKTLP